MINDQELSIRCGFKRKESDNHAFFSSPSILLMVAGWSASQKPTDKGHDNRLIELFFGINSAHSRSHQVKITHNYSLVCNNNVWGHKRVWCERERRLFNTFVCIRRVRVRVYDGVIGIKPFRRSITVHFTDLNIVNICNGACNSIRWIMLYVCSIY